jgi:ParB-like chromosome segregation protein Spo0J
LSPPPSGVFDEPGSEGRTHMLNDGYHRFAASIAVGFAQVPVIVVRSIADIKRGEGMA